MISVALDYHRQRLADWPSTDRHMYRQEDTSTHYPCTYFSHSTLIFEVEEALQKAGFLPGIAVVCLGATCS